MLSKVRIFLVFFISCGLFTWNIVLAENQKNIIPALIKQLEGGYCKYEVAGMQIKPRSFLTNIFAATGLYRRNDKEWCIYDAARCLGLLGPQAQSAVPALIDALKKYRNMDTGDGIISVRSAVAEALGKIQDPRAIKPLIEVLVCDDSTVILPTASGCKVVYGTTYHAVLGALADFGPQAKEAVTYIIPFLKNKDTLFYAIDALGKIKVVETVPVIIELLNSTSADDKYVFSAVVETLAEFGSQAKDALPKLRALLKILPDEGLLSRRAKVEWAIKKISE